MMSQKMGPLKMPEIKQSQDFSNAKEPTSGELSGVDFKSVLENANKEKQAEIQKEKDAVGPNGHINIGETKTDKEFREMLEKVTGKKQDKLKNKLEKDDYLNLMVTQLKNQDPLKPMDNQEMATQLAQFNTVEQLISMNKTLNDLKSTQQSQQADKASQYLDKYVQISGDKIRISEQGQVSTATFDLGAPAGTASIQIKNPNGDTVRTIGLGTLGIGNHKINWDGNDDLGKKCASGDYQMTIEATTSEGKPIPVKPQFITKVEAIKDLATGGKVDTQNGQFDLKDIVAIRSNAESTQPQAPLKPTLSPTTPNESRKPSSTLEIAHQ